MSDKIAFTLTLENGQFKVSAHEAKEALKGLGEESDKTGKKGSHSTNSFISTLGNLKMSTLAAWGAIAGGAAGIYALGKSFLSAAAGAEKNQVAFTTLLKSADKAKGLLAGLQSWANKTPFGMLDATSGAKRLIAFGVELENIIPLMSKLGDAAMGDAQTFDTLTLAYGKVVAKGKASMEELNMFTEAGVPIVQELARQFNTTTENILKMVETGKVGFPDVEKAITSMTTSGGQFAGMMEQQSSTLSGLWSSFEDVMGNVSRKVGGDMLPAFSNLLKALNESTTIVPIVTTLFRLLVAPISMFASALASVLNNIERAFGASRAESITAAKNEIAKLKEQQKGLNERSSDYIEIQSRIDALNKEIRTSNREEAIEELKGIDDKIKKYKELLAAKKQYLKENHMFGNIQAEKDINSSGIELGILSSQRSGALNKLNKANMASNQDTKTYKTYSGGGGTQTLPREAVEGWNNVDPNSTQKPKKNTVDDKLGNKDEPPDDSNKQPTNDFINYGVDVESKGFTTDVLSQTQSMVGQLDEIMNQATENELMRIDIRTQKKIDALNAEYEAEVNAINQSNLSQTEKDAKLKALDEKRARDQKAIEDKAAKEKRKIEHEAAKRQKAMKIIEIIIAGALGMIAAFQMGPIAGAVFAALIGAMTAASIGIVASQPLPPLATGVIDIPNDGPAFLHQGETVIPKTFTDSIKAGEMTLGGGGAQQIHINTSVQIDGNEIGRAVYSWFDDKAARRGVALGF